MRRRGFMMIEMLGALVLLSVFALVATRLFTASMRTIDKSSRAQNAIVRFDSMLDALRRDVWGAGQIEVSADGRALVVDDAIRWTIDEGRRDADGDGADESPPMITRELATEGVTRWPGAGLNVRFERCAGGLDVIASDRRTTLPSLMQIARGGRP